MLHQIRISRTCLSEHERDVLRQLAKTVLPAGRVFPAAGDRAVDRVDEFLAGLPRSLEQSYRALLRAFESSALLYTRRRFATLSAEQTLRVVHSWRNAGISRRLGLRALLAPLKVAHFDAPEFYQAIGCIYDFGAQQAEPEPRFVQQRSHASAALAQDLEIECDAVVVGTGAGGATVAKELAEKGHAVVIVEEGEYFKRSDFNGRAFEMQRRMYRNAGATFAIGNAGIPIPVGKTVGGTTTINSGTCYRIPERVLEKWRNEFGLRDFTSDMLAPYYERVERILRVEEARPEYLGGVARVIARGCDRLGYRHKPLMRNAPDCDGKGVCCFGCPTDAKRSTNVSYIPLALRAGAELFHGARVSEILVEGGRAVGVVAKTAAGDADEARAERTLTIRARAVVIACGALMTPVLLQENGLANSSGELGRNLSIHPAMASLAVFDEDISGFNAIPQGYSIEEFHDEGLLFEGASTPLDIGMTAVPFVGPRLIDLAENFNRVAMFGFMVEDSSRGRVRSIRGQTVITYRVNDRDVARFKRGTEILARVFFAAGARRVHPLVHGFDELRGEACLARFRRARLRARDFDLSAYHPLGTARMGLDGRTSVVGPDHAAHDLPGLYITDGSAVPSSIAVNPQVTIMAMATRAAEHIARSLT